MCSVILCLLPPFSVGWRDNFIVHIAQTLASSTQAAESWICLLRAESMLDHHDPFIHPVKNFSQVPHERWTAAEVFPIPGGEVQGQNNSLSS